jgi:hypothetical protein
VREAGDGGNNIRTLVHDDHRARTETRLSVLQGVEVHPETEYQLILAEQVRIYNLQNLVAGILWDNQHTASSRHDAKEIVPPSSNTTAVLLQELSQRN